MSDDEGSVTSSLRRLHISIPGTQHAKRSEFITNYIRAIIL